MPAINAQQPRETVSRAGFGRRMRMLIIVDDERKPAGALCDEYCEAEGDFERGVGEYGDGGQGDLGDSIADAAAIC